MIERSSDMTLVEGKGALIRRRDGRMVVLGDGTSVYFPMGTEASNLPAGTVVKVKVLIVGVGEEDS